MAKAKKKENLTPEERLRAALVPDWEQPYKVPENWCWVRLGELSTSQYGYTAKAIKNDVYPKMLRITDIQEYGVNWSDVPNCEITQDDLEKYRLSDGDIVIARTGATTGKSFLLNDPCNSVFASYLIRLRVGGKVFPKYVFNFFQTDNYWKQISELSSGIAQPGVNATKLQSLCFPLAPLPEQQRIVDRIEGLFAKLDEAKQKAQDALDSFETRKAAILHKAFTGELTARWRQVNGRTFSVAKHSLIEVFNFIDYRGMTPDKTDLGVPLITAKNIKKGYIDYRVSEFISYDTYLQRQSRGIAHRDDLLITTEAPLGNVALADQDIYSTAQRVIVLQVRDEYIAAVQNKYVMYYMLNDEFQNCLEAQKTGSTVAGIKAAKLKLVSIELPDVVEQTEIVRILDDLLAKEQQAKEAAEAVLEQIDLIKKSILARAFRGELGTNDPAEESAVELVKEVIEKES